MNDETRQAEVPDGQLVLRTENLVKKYGKRTVVSHVSIHLKQGEIVGLLGPNGAGKTTTFYMTVGLIVPNEGSIYLGDQNITKYPVYKGFLATLEVGQGDVLVHQQPLQLVKHGGMGLIAVPPEDLTGNDNPQGGAPFPHGPHLNRGGMGPQE